jgi:single-stranded-DNA-specific exonuclease
MQSRTWTRRSDRLERAIIEGQIVGIFGDYDADGITSTAILAGALRTAMPAAQVVTRLPQRTEGYGLNRAAIEEFRAAGVSLVVTVDCGSSDHDHAALVIDAGMDLLIVDHHHMDDEGPVGAIVVSPQLGADERTKALAAAGVAWLVVCGLAERNIDISPTFGTDATPYLDLVAMGTVADVAPLDGVNRGMVARGLGDDASRSAAWPECAGGSCRARAFDTDVIRHCVQPRSPPQCSRPARLPRHRAGIDAGSGHRDGAPAGPGGGEANQRRKKRGTQIHAEAWSAFCQEPGWESRVVFTAHSRHWEPGLIGAVASRLAEETRRPVILFHETNGHLSGSARSVEGFNLMTSLQAAEPILSRYGGHSLAAGVALHLEHIADLGDYLAAEVAKLGITVPLPAQLRIDATLPAEYLRIDTPRELARLEPFGRGNEEPLLAIRGAELSRYDAMGSDRSHLKLTCRAGGRQVEAVFWGAAWRSKELVGVRRVDLAGKLSINSWQGRERLQMVLQDFRPA